MKAAVSTDNGYVSAHFGRCPSFTLITIESGELVEAEEIPNPGHETGFLPRFLHEKGVDTIIAGGMGRRAIVLFEEFKITPIVGISGKVDDVISNLINGTLEPGESFCQPGGGKGYGLDKSDHGSDDHTCIKTDEA